MADQIRVDLVDNTSPGFASIEENLNSLDQAGEETQATLDDVVASIEKLSENMAKETRVVNEHTASWTHLGSVAIPAIAGMVENTLKYSVELGQLVAKQQALQAVAEKVATSQTAMNLAKEKGAKAAARVAGAITGYGEAVTGVLVVLAAVKASQIAYNTLLENTGKSADGLTNNLTRTREANSELWDDIKATAGAGAESVKDWGIETVANAAQAVTELTGVNAAWKEVDRAMTESTNNYLNNTRAIGEAIRGVSREAVKASREIAKAQAEAADDFERVRASNEEIAQSAADRAEAERLSSLQTVDAITAELEAMKQRRGEAAAANKFSEDDQRRYVATVGQLEQRRTEITKRESSERQKILDQEAQERAKSDRDYFERYEKSVNDSNDKILEEYRQQARKEIDERKARERAVDQLIEREFQKILDEERKKFEAMQQAAQQRLDLLKQEREQRIAMIQNADGADGKNLLQSARDQLTPEQVRAEFVRRARDQARANFTFQGDDARAAGAARNRAVKEAGVRAFRDFNAGRTNESDIAGAQNALIQNAAQAAQGRGQLDQSTLDALTQATQNQQAIVQTQQQQQQVIQQLQAALAGVGNASRNTFANGRRMANVR